MDALTIELYLSIFVIIVTVVIMKPLVSTDPGFRMFGG